MSQTQTVMAQSHFADPMAAQNNFASQFDVEHPNDAVSIYARIMHEHTKSQLTTATNSARRRSQGTTQPSLPKGHSVESVSSTGS